MVWKSRMKENFPYTLGGSVSCFLRSQPSAFVQILKNMQVRGLHSNFVAQEFLPASR